MHPKKIIKRKVVLVNVGDVDQTKDPPITSLNDSETAGDDSADNVVTLTGDEEESTDIPAELYVPK